MVSIIIPVYNTAIYLGRTIESVLAQTYENIEIILVNDGSVDRSGEICDEYAQGNPRVKVIHQKNSGVSVARNAGIDASSGRYIQFLDSDDELKKNMTETLVENMEEQDSDIVICGYFTVGQNIKETSIETCLYNRNEFLISSYVDPRVAPIVWSCWNMIFKSSIIKENNLWFDSSFVKGEDGLFTLGYIMKCKKVFALNQSFYRYNVYEPEERISAISHFSPDIYEFRVLYFERLFTELKYDINEQEKMMLLQIFYDKLIAGLVRLCAYSDYFSEGEIQERLRTIVNNEYVIQAGKIYAKKRKGDSVLIPLFMRRKSVKLLYVVFKNKGKKYIKKYGRSTLVKSVYLK